jgi:O-antigen ligase
MGLLIVLQHPVYILYVIALTLPIQVGVYIPELFDITFTLPVIISNIILLLILIKLLVSQRIPRFPYWLAWLTFSILASIAYMMSPSVLGPVQGLWFVYRMAFVPSLIYPVFFFLRPKPKHINTFLLLLATSTAVSGIIAVIQTTSGGNLLSGALTNQRFLGFLTPLPPEVASQDITVLKAHIYYGSIFRAHSTFYRANGYGAFLSVILILTWGQFLGSKGNLRIYIGALLTLQFAGLITTFSRSAWVAVVIGLGLSLVLDMFLGNQKKLTNRTLRLFIAGMVAVFIGLIIVQQDEAIRDRFTTILNPFQVNEVSWRMDIWMKALADIYKHPLFGTGTPAVTSVISSTGEQSLGAHNLLIGIGYEIGLLALGMFVFFIAKQLISSWRWIHGGRNQSEKLLAISCFSAMITYLISGFGSSLYSIENLALLFWLLLAVTLYSVRQLPNPQSVSAVIKSTNNSGLNEIPWKDS